MSTQKEKKLKVKLKKLKPKQRRIKKKKLPNLAALPQTLSRGGKAFETLLGDVLLKSKAPQHTAVALAEVQAVAIYFAASWCGPCRKFSHTLANIYMALKATGQIFEVVLVSADEDRKSWRRYYKGMPWLALPFANRDRMQFLRDKFKIQGVPSVVMLDGEANVICTAPEAMRAISNDPSGQDFPWIPPTFEQALGAELVDAKGSLHKTSKLRNTIIGVYFSAAWCEPCQAFTPMLRKVYDTVKSAGKEFEVVLVSADVCEDQFKTDFAKQPWLAVPFVPGGNKHLPHLLGVVGLPSLVLVDGLSGTVITTSGSDAVASDVLGEHFPWKPQHINNITMLLSKLNTQPGLIVFVKDAEEERRLTALLTDLAKEESAKKAAGEEVLFLTVVAGQPAALQVRGLMKLDPTLAVGLIDIAKGWSVHSSLKADEVSPGAVAEFLSRYREGGLKTVPLTR